MEWQAYATLLLGLLATAMLFGQWTALALGAVGTLMLFIVKGPLGLLAINSVIWNTANNYILIAAPMFLLMGEVILRSGVSGRFYTGVAALVGRTPGGLLHANIIACALFSCISGSSVATAASVGTVAIPEMTRRGYHQRLVFGSLAAGGTLGILIPPSIVMILYAALVEESVAKLFMAGFFPGLLMSALFMAYIALRVWTKPEIAPPPDDVRLPWRERLALGVHVLPIVTLLAAVLAAIYFGLTTPTEAAVMGAIGAIVLAWAYGGLSRAMFADALMSAVRTTCMVLFIIIGAQILANALSYAGISRGISSWVVAMELSWWFLLLALVILYLVLGCFVDGVSMIYITLPVLYPVVLQTGFNPIWFGVVLTILIELGQITPPVGLNLFTIHGISGGAPFSEVVKGSIPFVFIMLLTILLLALFPGIALWLPSTM